MANKTTIGELDRGDWFWFEFQPYVILDHYQAFTDVIHFDDSGDGKMLGLNKFNKDTEVNYAGKTFMEACDFYKY